jgi:xylulokinase
MPRAVLGVDVGTSSSKGVIVDFSGQILAQTSRDHAVSRPQPGWAEMDPALWWSEFTSISQELAQLTEVEIVAVGVSGMGPCVAIADQRGVPLRDAILYGIDSRATAQIESLTSELGADAILARAGSALSTQAVGPKLAWLADNEPDTFAEAEKLFMPSSWLAYNLTGEYILDHHSASQCAPLYDSDEQGWFEPWCHLVAPALELPSLLWPGDVAGVVTVASAAQTGLPAGIPVIAGTIDAWTEAVSVGAQSPGDLMLMYGTTMFLINTMTHRVGGPGLWSTVGAFPGTRNLAGGMATSGAITNWLRDLFGRPTFEALLNEAKTSGAGARGLLMLPYFAGERTPIADPDARGILAGLTIEHTRGDLYRAALEAIAFGVRHNLDAFSAAGGRIDRVVAVGGGTQGPLWTQIVSDVTGLTQEVNRVTVGASYGAAFLAASVSDDVDIQQWNPVIRRVIPNPDSAELYNEMFGLFRSLYESTVSIAHHLAALQKS